MWQLIDNPEFWVLVAFLIFVGILVHFKVPSLITDALDARAASIRKELDEARRLREEAQQLLADYQKKSREAEEEAGIIIEQARHEAEALAAETHRALQESVERRTKLAEEKIASAEAQALSEVRSTAVDVALAAAERLLKDRIDGETSAHLIEQSISDLKGKLN